MALVSDCLLVCVCRDQWLDAEVKCMSTCELEVDVVAADIINRLHLSGKAKDLCVATYLDRKSVGIDNYVN